MKKRFKARKKIPILFLKTIILLIIMVFSFGLAFKFFYNKIHIKLDNEKFIDYLVHDALGTYDLGDLTSLNSTEFLLKYSLGIEKSTNLVSKEVTSEIEEPKPEEKENVNQEPIVYIYNTHQSEGYKTNFLESFNINNTVLIGSYILKEYLNDLGINSVVEEEKIADILAQNNWKYGYSYRASRQLLDKAKKAQPSLKYFIDFHRDSSPYTATVTEINGEKYARVLFVVGLEHDNYQANLAEAEKINEKIKKINVSLSRGIMQKKGPGVNGIYNQDNSKYTFLIEVGGQYNTIEEINNTLKMLAKVLHEYITEVENEGQKT